MTTTEGVLAASDWWVLEEPTLGVMTTNEGSRRQTIAGIVENGVLAGFPMV
ncbi:MAG: hypothetical protein PUK59_02165 [Actinomycetaceae bacterium]|nr:hypothetical protein [Actinomycetaceae bacterium]MDY5853966.1 hypothetical protein [Arcanobacterium sp.]